MAITQGSATVGTVATQLNSAQAMPGILYVSNLDNTDTVYLGGAAVTIGQGQMLMKSNETDIHIFPEQVIYAVSSKTGHHVSWLHITP